MRGANGLGADAQDRGLAGRADPEMPAVQQEIHAMLFELNRIRSVVRDALHDFNRGNLNLKPARRALIGVNASRDDHARLLRQAAQSFKRRRLILQRYDALDRSRAVAKDGEKQFPRFAQVVQPTAQRDFLAIMLPDILNGHYWHGARFSPLRSSMDLIHTPAEQITFCSSSRSDRDEGLLAY